MQCQERTGTFQHLINNLFYVCRQNQENCEQLSIALTSNLHKFQRHSGKRRDPSREYICYNHFHCSKFIIA